MRTLRTLVTTTTIAGLAAGALVGGLLAGPAGAAPPALDKAKADCTAAIVARFGELDRLTVEVSKAKNLTPPHRSSANDIVTSSRAGLTTLKAKIDADADAATLKADCESIRTDFRVYALRAPQIHEVIAADAETAATTELLTTATKLAAVVAGLPSTVDTTAAKAALDDMNAKLADAGTVLTGVADRIIVLTPADHNANPAVLDPDHASLKTGRGDLRAAGADAKTVVRFLKGLKK
jgi:hypothetical protein